MTEQVWRVCKPWSGMPYSAIAALHSCRRKGKVFAKFRALSIDTFVPSQRADGQKQVIVMMHEDFLRDIERALARIGYSDRSSLIRDAVFEKLATEGIRVDYKRALAPSRSGKGGTKGKGAKVVNEEARVSEEAVIYRKKRKKKA